MVEGHMVHKKKGALKLKILKVIVFIILQLINLVLMVLIEDLSQLMIILQPIKKNVFLGERNI